MIFNLLKNKKQEGYTLVEILVVIAIIGILSSVTFVAFSSAREKSRMSTAKMFEVNKLVSARNYLISEWKFEEGTGNIAYNSSSDDNGVFVGSPSWSNETYDTSTSKKSLYFPFGSYIKLNQILGIMDSNFSISMWIKTIVSTGQAYIVYNAGNILGYRFGIGGGSLIFLIGNDSSYVETNCTTKTVNDDKWHHVAISFDRENKKVTCFIDGKEEGYKDLNSGYYGGSTEYLTKIGSGYDNKYQGNLDNVRIFTSSLSASDIQKLYAEESVQRKLAEAN